MTDADVVLTRPVHDNRPLSGKETSAIHHVNFVIEFGKPDPDAVDPAGNIIPRS